MLRKPLLLVIFAVFILIGCADKKEVKLSTEAESSLEAIERTELIKGAYLQRDMEKLEVLIEKKLLNKIKDNMDFQEAKLDISSPRIIRINEEKIRLHINWYGEWTISNRRFKRSGIGIFTFDKRSMKLVNIEGDNPFIPVEIE